MLVPHTKETDRPHRPSVFDAMKPSGVLINIARGGVVDEDALIDGAARGKIRGAGLDVFKVEPLPKESPLWDMPNVFITSHVGGMADTYGEQVMPLLIENLRAFSAGQPEKMRFIVKRTLIVARIERSEIRGRPSTWRSRSRVSLRSTRATRK